VTDDVNRACGPARVEHERIADRPRFTVFDRHREAVELVTVRIPARKQNLETVTNVQMPPSDRGGARSS
jgi:hypothetical protein